MERVAWIVALEAEANKNGYAVAPTTDGYVFMFKRNKLQAMLLSDASPALSFNLTGSDGKVATPARLEKSKLQAQLDANPEAPLLMVVYFHDSIKN